jgi:hypothetical protein
MRQVSHVTVVFIVTAKRERGYRFRRVVALIALTALVGSFAWLLFLLPVYLGFALSVGSAIGWCIWIEHHPEPRSLDLDDPGRRLSSTHTPKPGQAAFHCSDIEFHVRRRCRDGA